MKTYLLTLVCLMGASACAQTPARTANDSHFDQAGATAEASIAPTPVEVPHDGFDWATADEAAPGTDAAPPKVSEALAPPTMNQAPPAIEPSPNAPHGPIVPAALHSSFAVDTAAKP